MSIVGTFELMLAFGFSINVLSLFGLILAIGIVVDDAIVVVENVERNIANGLKPRDATVAAMKEVTGPIALTSPSPALRRGDGDADRAGHTLDHAVRVG